MADAHIGSLSLQIEASSKDAASSITELQKQLRSLNSAVGKATALQSYARGLADLGRAAAQLSAFGDLERVANSIQKLNGVKLSKTIATNLQALNTSLSGLDATNLGALNSLAAALAPISTIDTKGFNSTLRSLGKLPPALAELQNIDLGAAKGTLKQLSKLFSGLQGASKEGGFNATITALKKLPTALADLQNIDIAAIAPQLDDIATAIRPLADEMAKIGTAAPVVSKGFAYMGNAAQRAATGTNVFGRALNRIFSYAFVRRVYNVLGGLIDRSTKYVEDLNLFTVAMGEYAEEAQKYAETVSEAMGIDVAQWLRGQGVFQTLASGFGVTSDRAAIMSKNLTQLAYDLSSFYNLSVDDAFQKLQSGFAGEIEPVRRLGYDLSKTNLQATAASLGITKLFADMTQAEKSQLRYYALMTQVTQVQGDMARTLEAPANQLRVLRAQMEMAGRALGNIFIPLLNKVLPYLIAAAKFVRMLADEVARFFGFELPEIDYSDVGSGVPSVADDVEDLDNALGGAGKRAKELKNLLAGFDELNIIQAEVGGGAGGGAGGNGDVGGGWKDFELPQYDFLKDAVNGKVEAILAKWKKQLEKLKPVIKWIKDNFDKILDVLKAIGLALLAWKVSSTALNFLQSLGALKGLNVPRMALGLSLMVGGFSFAFNGWKEIGGGSKELWSYLKAGIGSALGLVGSLLAFGTGPAGWIIGIGAVITVALTGFRLGQKERFQAQVEQEFAEAFNGAINPDDYIKIVQQRFNKITEGLQGGLQLKVEIDAELQEFGDLMAEIDKYGLKIAGVGTLTDDEVTQMNDAFKRLKEVGGKYIEDSYALIEDGLLNALRVLPEDAKNAVTGYLQELGRLEGEGKTQLETYTDSYQQALQMALSAPDNSAERQKYLDEAANWKLALGYITGDIVDAGVQFKSAMVSADADITQVNFDSFESVNEFLEKLNGIRSDAEQQIREYWAAYDLAARSQLRAAELVGDTAGIEEWTAKLLLGERALAAQVEEVNGAYLNEIIPLAESGLDAFVKAYEGAWDEAESRFATSDQIEGALGIRGPAQWARNIFQGGKTLFEYELDKAQKEVVDTYQKNFIDPVTKELTSSGSSELSSVGATLAKAFGGSFVLSEFSPDGSSGYSSVVTHDPLEAVGYTLAELRQKVPDMKKAGTDLADSFGTGLAETTSRHMRETRFAVEGAIEGLEGIEGTAGNVGKDIGGSFGSNLVNEVTARTNEVGRRLAGWWKNIKPKGGNPSDPYSWGNIEITPFASGGFPRAGSLFLAGEAGPEIVGTMGGQTAVANSDQIVAGIAYGVSMANAEETRLMRELVNICSQLLSKGGNVVFTPSAEAGSVISRSLDMYSTQRGY